MKTKIIFLNESEIKIETLQSIHLKIKEYFKFRVPNYFFNPKYKSGLWDGFISLYNLKTKTLPIGLFEKLISFFNKEGIAFEILKNKNEKYFFNEEEINKLIDSFKIPYQLKDYQKNGVFEALLRKKCLLISPTASGKSLIIYLIIRSLLKKIKLNEKILLIVPRVSLVDQMYNDFIEYGFNEIEFYTHKIYQGQNKNTRKQLIISTWQSLQNLPNNFFHQFKAVIVDEAHIIQGISGNIKKVIKIMQKILVNSINAEFKIGTTGTIRNKNMNDLQLISYFGNLVDLISTKELIENNIISNLKINILKLSYTDFKKTYLDYQDEIKYILKNKERLNFLVNLITKKCNKTSIVLFQRIKFGKIILKKILDYYQKNQINRNIAYIDGQNIYFNGKIYKNTQKREEIRQFAFNNPYDDLLIIASYGVFSMGINIKNIHNIVFAHPLKSDITVLQSIGRGLRKDIRKRKLIIYDIADNLKYGKRHLNERLKIYIKEGFEFELIELKI